MHNIKKLIDNMPATLVELGRKSGVSERSVMRMRDGKRMQRSTANKILRGLSKLYGETFTLSNVTGINLVSRDNQED